MSALVRYQDRPQQATWMVHFVGRGCAEEAAVQAAMNRVVKRMITDIVERNKNWRPPSAHQRRVWAATDRAHRRAAEPVSISLPGAVWYPNVNLCGDD